MSDFKDSESSRTSRTNEGRKGKRQTDRKRHDTETVEEKEEDLQREEGAKLSNSSSNPSEGDKEGWTASTELSAIELQVT